MIKAAIGALTGIAVVFGSAASGRAQEAASQNKPIVAAFEHYEGVRVALSSDRLADVSAHARQLAAQVEAVAGEAAKKAADQLASAKSLEDARSHFGELSVILVPVFQQEAIPGTSAFMCSMKNKPWVQRGDKVQNPYYGTAMATCGSPLPGKTK